MFEDQIIPTATFPGPSRTGEMFGLNKHQLGLAFVALSWPLYLIAVAGDLGSVLPVLFFWTLPLGVLACGRIGNTTFLQYFTRIGGFGVRKITGQTKYLPRMRPRDYKKDRIPLPGGIGERCHWVEMRGVDTGVGAGGTFVYDALAGQQTASAIIRVSSESWQNADDQEKARRAHATSMFGKRLSEIGVKRIAMYSRTYEISRNKLPTPATIGDYTKLGELARIDHIELSTKTQLSTPIRRDTIIAVTISEKDSQKEIHAHGGGVIGMSRVLSNRVGIVLDMLEDCGASFVDGWWLGKEGIWGAVRLAYEPQAGPFLDENNHLQPTDTPVVSVAEENFTYLYTRESFHRTYYMEAWPTTQVEAGFLYPLIAEGDVPRTVCQIWEPQTFRETEKKFNNLRASRATVDQVNFSLGRRDSISHQAEAEEMAKQHQEMLAGFPNVNYSAWVTIHARSIEELEQSHMWVQNAARGIRLQQFNGGHARAFATAALPLGYRDADL